MDLSWEKDAELHSGKLSSLGMYFLFLADYLIVFLLMFVLFYLFFFVLWLLFLMPGLNVCVFVHFQGFAFCCPCCFCFAKKKKKTLIKMSFKRKGKQTFFLLFNLSKTQERLDLCNTKQLENKSYHLTKVQGVIKSFFKHPKAYFLCIYT